MTDVANKEALIADMLETAQASIFKIEAMSNDGYVQECAGLFVNDTNWLGGLTLATVYTAEHLDACAKFEVGLPTYTNGNGDRSKLITVTQAKAIAVEKLLAHIEMLRNL